MATGNLLILSLRPSQDRRRQLAALERIARAPATLHQGQEIPHLVQNYHQRLLQHHQQQQSQLFSDDSR